MGGKVSAGKYFSHWYLSCIFTMMPLLAGVFIYISEN